MPDTTAEAEAAPSTTTATNVCPECGATFKDGPRHADSHYPPTADIPREHYLARFRAMTLRGERIPDDLKRAARADYDRASANDLHAHR